jgi:hypothetical protein
MNKTAYLIKSLAKLSHILDASGHTKSSLYAIKALETLVAKAQEECGCSDKNNTEDSDDERAAIMSAIEKLEADIEDSKKLNTSTKYNLYHGQINRLQNRLKQLDGETGDFDFSNMSETRYYNEDDIDGEPNYTSLDNLKYDDDLSGEANMALMRLRRYEEDRDATRLRGEDPVYCGEACSKSHDGGHDQIAEHRDRANYYQEILAGRAQARQERAAKHKL